jgi:hypothetical protein
MLTHSFSTSPNWELLKVGCGETLTIYKEEEAQKILVLIFKIRFGLVIMALNFYSKFLLSLCPPLSSTIHGFSGSGSIVDSFSN